VKDVDLDVDNNGVIKKGTIVYEKEGETKDVDFNGLKLPDENGKTSCEEKGCSLVIGKNTYGNHFRNTHAKTASSKSGHVIWRHD